MRPYRLLLPALALLALPIAGQAADLVYVGSFTSAQSKGIYCFRFDPSTGEATAPELAAETSNPSFLAVHPNNKVLYSVASAVRKTGEGGAVEAYSIDRTTGKLTLINRVSAIGKGPSFVGLDRTAKYVLIANYYSGSVAAYPLRADFGIGESTAFVQHTGTSVHPRQNVPHPHSIYLSPDNRFVLVPDLGADKVVIYRFDQGKLTPHGAATVKPGAGPRHFAFHPNGKFAYLLNEIGSTVTAFAWDAKQGTLKELQTISALPADFKGESTTAEVLIDDAGRFLYASNRGDDSIAVFSIDAKKGTLALVQRVPTLGKMPRNFRLDPSGKYVFAANMESDNIVIFRRNPATGKLTATGKTVAVPTPTCVKFVP